MQKNYSLGQSGLSRGDLVQNWTRRFRNADVSTQDITVGVVASIYNSNVVKLVLNEVLGCLNDLGIAKENIIVEKVPGALEIPFVLQQLAEVIQPSAMIALGCVIRGETYHFEVVSNGVFDGVMRVQLDTRIPIANGVLTCESIDQAIDRQKSKAHECVDVVVELIVFSKKNEKA